MDKSNPPESFGVFKPVGHIVIAFRNSADLLAAIGLLREQGFAESALVTYNPDEMLAQADADTHNASPLAALGQDLNLVKAHRELALEGCSFLVVEAEDDERAELVTRVAHAQHAVTAQRYGRFIVEELVDATGAEPQVFESSDRGLDSAGGTAADTAVRA